MTSTHTSSILVLEDVFYCDTVFKTQLFDLFFIKRYLLKMIYLYFYENIFQDKSIDMIFTFSNSIT
jgi:hypothetical protein